MLLILTFCTRLCSKSWRLFVSFLSSTYKFFFFAYHCEAMFLLFNVTISCMYTQVHVRLKCSGFLQVVLFWPINCSLGVKMVKFLEKVQGKCNWCIGISDGYKNEVEGAKFPVMPMVRTRGSGHKLKHTRWHILWHRLPAEFVESPCLEILIVLGSWLGGPVWAGEGWTKWPPEVPFQTHPFFVLWSEICLWLVSLFQCTVCWRR